MRRLANKTCIITGAAGGIGSAAVRTFVREGANVVAADVNDAGGRRLESEYQSLGSGGRVAYVHCDVTQEADVARLMEIAQSMFGRIDAMFNNAGVGGAFGRIIETRTADWDRTIEMILRGAFLGCKHAARAMIEQSGGGSIVNNASVVARVGDSAGAAYSAAKAGVLILTRCAAVELAEHRIRVNSISPGTIITPLLHRGEPADSLCQAAIQHQPWPEVDVGVCVAEAAAFLASHDSRFITGADWAVDGGACAVGPGFDQAEGSVRSMLDQMYGPQDLQDVVP